ncbi:lanthionine synthetase LanC family protein [uncultured Aquimarina sp.]|uniref:lanthionine synthetase LanC family protein n=1 Tax=uncultured Aquimarina sp. TaxID=575652 RepID=UPI0026134333|nr:lanthionine synthetase LanC family protein [uncultured Aquimarina sp.]
MFSKELDHKEEILSLAMKYGDFLIENQLNQVANVLDGIINHDIEDQEIKESIESGVSGNILFLIELYSLTKKERYLQLILSLVSKLIPYCKKKPNYNYSLYKGRSGFIYILIKVYEITNDNNILKEAIAIANGVTSEYIDCDYVSDYLYNGRSGTLLVYFQLYILTQDFLIKENVYKLYSKIIQGIHLNNEGVSWKAKEEINIRNLSGFAYGVTGIKHVFEQIDIALSNRPFKFLIEEITRYQNSSWITNNQNWGDYRKDIENGNDLLRYKEMFRNENLDLTPGDNFSWAFGFFGIKGKEKGSDNIKDKLKEVYNSNCDINLFEGISGIGLCIFESGQDNNKLLEDVINKMNNSEIDVSGGLLFGNVGAVYFLLKSISQRVDQTDNILYPKLNSDKRTIEDELFISVDETRKVIHRRRRRSIVGLLEKNFPKNLAASLNSKLNRDEKKNEVELFDFYVNGIINLTKDSPINELFQDALYFDKQKESFLKENKKPLIKSYLEERIHQDNVIALLNKTDKYLLNQTLKVSKQLKIIKTKWNWNDEELDPVENLYYAPKEFETLLQIDVEKGVLETSLKNSIIVKMIIGCFSEPKTVQKTIREIKDFFQSQPEDLLKEYSVNTRSRNIEDFISRLDYIILFQVKRFLYQNTLIIEK